MKRVIIILLFIFPSVLCKAQLTEKLIVYFKFNDYTLDDSYKNKIDSLLQKDSISKVQIEAHCDSIGSYEYNDTLSLKRALEVRQYLLVKKFNTDQLTIKAMGKRFPLNKNENETERALNRRAEILFINKEIKPIVKVDTILKDTTTVNINEIKIGSSFKLENLNFVGGRHKLLPRSDKALRLLLNTMKTYPSLEIEIQGYVCCTPDNEDGEDLDYWTNDLSVNRAKAIYDYLITNGITPSRLSYKGYGGKNKLADESTEWGRETNRRVEFKIIKK